MSNFSRAGRKIVAIGRNYAKHAKELGNTVPQKPFFFLKPTSSYTFTGGKVEIPRGVIVHHEVELGVVIGKAGRNVAAARAEDHVAGYALGIDMTGRNVQDAAKKMGLPWSAAKGFDTFTPISKFIPKGAIADPSNLNLWLKINGTLKQSGNTSDMIFGIPRLIEYVSSIMTLEEGDLLLTGTPAGVGPIAAGDKITAGIQLPSSNETLTTLELDVVDRIGGYIFDA